MNATNKFVCIHGHFYQPPRENAWLETIEKQDSAAPFHNWNARINFECYAPNTAARILDEEQRIQQIINNYTRISFNFGPTLLSWMEKADPSTYQAILQADKISAARYNGHGSAIAQAHSHLIMPLTNDRDRETQVVWGIRDFEHRFQRSPEGMWLSETAANTATLEVLAANGIQFTILAPRQAKAIRKLNGGGNWSAVNAETVDTRRPYLIELPSGKSIVVFFYHGGVSQAVAFDGLLNNGRYFAERLTSVFDANEQEQLLHIATDGESYGHHHRHGEMALAACLRHIEEHNLANLINYGAYLEAFPPIYEAQIHENSSWSCVHGVERWRSNCGCSTGGHANWNQKWRAPLRETLDWLRDELIPIYEEQAAPLLKDPWAARNAYIDVLLSREDAVTDTFIAEQAKKKLVDKERVHLLRLMEMQRQAMQMFTSCGWFFDEVSGIETLQILQYANRAIYYARQVGKVDLHERFMDRLKAIPSNVYQSGAVAYEEFVVPARVDLERVGMHYAAASLFDRYPERLEFFNYIATSEVYERLIAGYQRFAVGRATVKSKISNSEKHFSFAVLYLGQQTILGNISKTMDRKTFDEMHERSFAAFQATNISEVIGLTQEYFGPRQYSIWHLFRDEKRKILNEIVNKSIQQAENAYREIYGDNYQLMSGIKQSGMPIPKAYLSATQFILNKDLHRLFEEEDTFSVKELERLQGEFKKWEVEKSDASSLRLAVSEWIYRQLRLLQTFELNLEQLQGLVAALQVLKDMEVVPNFWKSQNLYFSMVKGYKSNEWVFANKDWEKAFFQLGDLLSVGL